MPFRDFPIYTHSENVEGKKHPLKLMHLKPGEVFEEIQDKFKAFCQKLKSGELLKMDSEELFLPANKIVHMADVIRAHHRH